MMKNWLIALCLLMLAACSNNWDDQLDGKWQLQTVEQGGTVLAVDTIYYNFQNTLFMYQTYSPASDKYRKSYGFNALEGDKLLLELDNNPQPVHLFLPFTDWTSTKRTFLIEKHSGSQLIISSDGRRYTFRKF
ncbi:MAG: lipocalin-like domain-containing protein [Tannerellaceae bacterium]